MFEYTRVIIIVLRCRTVLISIRIGNIEKRNWDIQEPMVEINSKHERFCVDVPNKECAEMLIIAQFSWFALEWLVIYSLWRMKLGKSYIHQNITVQAGEKVTCMNQVQCFSPTTKGLF